MVSAPRCILLAGVLALGGNAAGEANSVREIHGRVLIPDGGSPVGLRARVSAGADRDSADLAADGSFVLRLARPRCDSVDVEISSIADSAPRYHPAVARFGVSSGSLSQPTSLVETGPPPLRWESDPPAPDSLRIVLVPTGYTIESGTYVGETVPISIHAALAATGRPSRFWRSAGSPLGKGTPVGWSESNLPLYLLLDVSPGAVSSPDTAAFWSVARRLERDFGQPLFRPATDDVIADEAWHVTVRLAPTSIDAGSTFMYWAAAGTVFGAAIELRSASLLRDERIVTHELLHALGVGHSAWSPSVMRAGEVARATPQDIAYAKLLYRIRAAHVAGRATHGVDAAVAWRTRASGCGSDGLGMSRWP